MLRDLDNQSKPWDGKVQLFHRIDSPRFDKNRDPASGKGYECGARAPGDLKPSALSDILSNGVAKALGGLLQAIPVVGQIITTVNSLSSKFTKDGKTLLDEAEDALADFISKEVEGALFGKYMRSIPAWVPVERKGFPKVTNDVRTETFDNDDKKEIEHEVEGQLTHSFQTLRAIPYIQWNRWYAWSFHVQPIDGYGYVLGNGNVATADELKAENDDGNDLLEFVTDVNTDDTRKNHGGLHSMACMVDLGAFGVLPGDNGGTPRVPGAFFHPSWPFWPTAGDYFWGCGRWVYDCTHVTSNDKEGSNEGLMPTQLHPLKAFAASRYEGFKFDENEKPTPAVRFMFFACKNGGYLDFGTDGKDEQDTECGIKFNDKDYSFIVDLPKAFDPVLLQWPIGHTPDFPSNTVVIRPTMLVDLKMAPYGIPTGLSSAFFRDNVSFDQGLLPIIELLEPADPKVPQNRQVKITVELSKIDAAKTAYGFCVSLGWFDPTGTQADFTKKVDFSWKALTSLLDGYDNLRLNFGVNGRFLFGAFKADENKPVDVSFKLPSLYVPDDASVRVSINGMNRNGYGEAMETHPTFTSSRLDGDRTLEMGGIVGLPDALREAIAKGDELVKTAAGQVFKTDFLKNLSSEALSILEGTRKVVEWKKHIDQEDNDIAAIVAREMFAKIVPLFSNENDPVALADSETGLAESQTLELIGSPTGASLDMNNVAKFMDQDGVDERNFDLTVETKPLSFVGAADNIAQHLTESMSVTASAKVTRQ